MNLRIKKLRDSLTLKGLDGLLTCHSPNVSYLSGIQSRESCLLVTRNSCVYFTDSRYSEEARKQSKGKFRVIQIRGPLFEELAYYCAKSKIKRLGIEGDHLSLAHYRKLRSLLKKPCRIIPASGLIEELRQVKDKEELKLIRKALKITASALCFCRRILKPGKKEIEIVGELERFIRQKGASKSAFDIIVASGPNSSFPHHIPGERRLRNNEPVMVDMGVDYQGYKSDLTRVFFLGKMDGLAAKTGAVVLGAQQEAIKTVRPGIKAYQVDRAGRQYIEKAGLGRYFGHSIGHGLGIEVHEAPQISKKGDTTLKPGMVFTVEPAVYLPGKFGIRIEDMVLVTRKGCEVLSGAINK